MSGPHLKWLAAIAASEVGDWGPLIALAMCSSDDTCRCEDPILDGDDLMCRACLHRNQGQVDRRVAYVNEPHVFEAGDSNAAERMGFCARCVRLPDDPRHIDREVQS